MENKSIINGVQGYMLISVSEREILTERFSSLADAQHQMHTEMIEWGKVPEEVFRGYVKEYENTEYGFGKYCGWANNGINHADYDWLIVSL